MCNEGAKQIRADGHSIPALLEAILTLMPLDTYCWSPVSFFLNSWNKQKTCGRMQIWFSSRPASWIWPIRTGAKAYRNRLCGRNTSGWWRKPKNATFHCKFWIKKKKKEIHNLIVLFSWHINNKKWITRQTMERFDFYGRARKAFAIVQTGLVYF